MLKSNEMNHWAKQSAS